MSNPRIFLAADTHFGHRAIIGFEKGARPFASIEEHDAELVKRWNATVKKTDTVWHLGDVVFGAANLGILWKLNGIKKLVSGNHDMYPTVEYLKYFSRVQGAVELSGCICTHIPVHPDQFKRYRLNIHGHLHSEKLQDRRYVCVSAEQTDLRPILLEDAVRRGQRD